MRLVTLLLFVSLTICVSAQNKLLKKLPLPDVGTLVSVIPSGNNGWSIFMMDSLRLARFDACGNEEWVHRYSFINRETNMGDIISLKNGGYALVVRSQENVAVTKIDDQGSIIWSKEYKNQDYQNYPYTIMEDDDENLYVYGNIGHKFQSNHFSCVLKLNENGTVLSANKYDSNPIWGGAILTSDGGILARSGSEFFKIDANGDVEWATRLLFGSQHFLKPIEVSDGYVFTGNTPAVGHIYLQKLDKDGNGLDGVVTNYLHNPSTLISLSNGNLRSVFREFKNGRMFSCAVEFDENLNVVKQKHLDGQGLNQGFNVRELCLLNNGGTVIAGSTVPENQLFYSVFDQQLTTSCDTSMPDMVTFPLGASYSGHFINRTNFSYVESNITPRVDVLSSSAVNLCFEVGPLQVDLGNDTLICDGETLTLTNLSSSNFDGYIWSTGATTQGEQVIAPTTVALGGIDFCTQDTIWDTLVIVSYPKNYPDLGPDVQVCVDSLVTIVGDTCANCTYLWNTGDTTSNLILTTEGSYIYKLINTFGCEASDTLEYSTIYCNSDYVIPNVVTPNGDGINDLFTINGEEIGKFEMSIYNRWGVEVFFTEQINRGWDGRSAAGLELPSGTYFYIINMEVYEEEVKVNKTYKGNLTLLK